MTPSDKIHEYSKAVCTQIRWKKAHTVVSEEIENHLIDQKDAYMADGTDESAATDKAITQMGDPVIVGTQLDRTHRPRPQWAMLVLSAILLLTGLLIRIFFISSAEQWLVPTIISVIIGLGLMTVAYLLDFTLIGRYPKTIYFAILVLSVTALLTIPVIRGNIHDYLALLFPLGFAAIIYATKNKGYRGIILCELSFIFPAVLAIYIPSTSGLLLFAFSGLVILCLAISMKWFNTKVLHGYLIVLIPVAIVLLIVFVVFISRSYRCERIQALFDPSSYSGDIGYIACQIKALFAGSNFIGHGVIVPEPTANGVWMGNGTDYLLTYLIFNIGWISFIIIMGLLLFFIMKGFLLCFRQKSGLALFVSVSVMITFTLQVLGYVMANLGFPIIVPISLPLISYGHGATIVNLALIGIMLSVFRTGHIVKNKYSIVTPTHERLFSFHIGKLIFSVKKK